MDWLFYSWAVFSWSESSFVVLFTLSQRWGVVRNIIDAHQIKSGVNAEHEEINTDGGEEMVFCSYVWLIIGYCWSLLCGCHPWVVYLTCTWCFRNTDAVLADPSHDEQLHRHTLVLIINCILAFSRHLSKQEVKQWSDMKWNYFVKSLN